MADLLYFKFKRYKIISLFLLWALALGKCNIFHIQIGRLSCCFSNFWFLCPNVLLGINSQDSTVKK